jgi:hypothetical protein
MTSRVGEAVHWGQRLGEERELRGPLRMWGLGSRENGKSLPHRKRKRRQE